MPETQPHFIYEDLARIYPELSERLAPLNEKTLFITGGAGFIGSWIAELIYFLNKNHNASVKTYLLDRDIDNLERTMPHITNDEMFTTIQCDTRDITEIPKQVNYIVHAAATPDRRYHASSPIDVMTSIAEGTARILQQSANLSELMMFLNVSSSSVYQSNNQYPLISESEKGKPLANTSPDIFSEANRYAETFCAAMRSEQEIPISTIRPFTFCGPYQSLNAPWFLNSFIKDFINNRSIRLTGDGTSTRSLLYGADVAFWILAILLNCKSGETFNVGSDQGVLIKDIAKMVAEDINPSKSVDIKSAPISSGKTSLLVPDTSSARAQFDLRVYTDTTLAISRTTSWYMSQK